MSSSNTNFRDVFYAWFPALFRSGNGEKYIYTLELARDTQIAKAVQASKFHMPGLGDPSQLPYLAFDRSLVQGPAEPNPSFVTRLSNSIQRWKLAGNRVLTINDLQSYLQGLQPGADPTTPLLAIVSSAPAQTATPGNSFTYAATSQWDVAKHGDSVSATPAKTRAAVFNWDGITKYWRAWLVIFPALVPTGVSGSTAAITLASGGSFASPGQNVNGVWVPATSGTPINAPFLTVTGLSGITNAMLYSWLTMFSGGSTPTNTGTFQIVQILSSSSVVIANPIGVAPDLSLTNWSVSAYPFMAPGPVWGAAGAVIGQGESQIPPLDFGSTIGGVWQPSAGLGTTPTVSWGMQISAEVVNTIRGLLRTRKSSPAWYDTIIVSYAGANGAAGSEYSPQSAAGGGNPDGTFGERGKNVAGVWVPTRQISSSYDCHISGTARNVACSVLNVN